MLLEREREGERGREREREGERGREKEREREREKEKETCPVMHFSVYWERKTCLSTHCPFPWNYDVPMCCTSVYSAPYVLQKKSVVSSSEFTTFFLLATDLKFENHSNH